MLHGQAKADAVRAIAEQEGIDLATSYAYGDSTNDVAILSEVGFPCAINPDRRLRRLRRRRWAGRCASSATAAATPAAAPPWPAWPGWRGPAGSSRGPSCARGAGPGDGEDVL